MASVSDMAKAMTPKASAASRPSLRSLSFSARTLATMAARHCSIGADAGPCAGQIDATIVVASVASDSRSDTGTRPTSGWSGTRSMAFR